MSRHNLSITKKTKTLTVDYWHGAKDVYALRDFSESAINAMALRGLQVLIQDFSVPASDSRNARSRVSLMIERLKDM